MELRWCTDCGMRTWHDVDVLDPWDRDEDEFQALICRACGHVERTDF